MSERLLPLTRLSRTIYQGLMGMLRPARSESADLPAARNAYRAFLIHEGLRV